jgi:hypothetical protein
MKLFYCLIICLILFDTRADDISVPFPDQSRSVQKTKAEVPDDLKGLVWNKWSTKNFIIISIDKSQGVYLKNNIEKVKTWLVTRWGLDDFDFSGDCKIVCVSNKNLLKRIFKLDNPKFEVRKNNDKIELCAIWFSLEDYQKDMPLFELMKICLAQKETYSKNDLSFCNDGICFLSQNFEVIKQTILENENSLSKIEFGDKMNEVQSGVVCLLMRKEYGQENFLKYLVDKNLSCYGFDDQTKFASVLSRYCKNLIEDLKNNKTPKDYIKINRR